MVVGIGCGLVGGLSVGGCVGGVVVGVVCGLVVWGVRCSKVVLVLCVFCVMCVVFLVEVCGVGCIGGGVIEGFEVMVWLLEGSVLLGVGMVVVRLVVVNWWVWVVLVLVVSCVVSVVVCWCCFSGMCLFILVSVELVWLMLVCCVRLVSV